MFGRLESFCTSYILLMIIHAGCGSEKTAAPPLTSMGRQDESTLALRTTTSVPIELHQTHESHPVPTDHYQIISNNAKGPIEENLVDIPASDSARSSVSSISSLWGRDPSEEIMNELPPCGSFAPIEYPPFAISDGDRLDFRIRMVDFKTASEYSRLMESYRRHWRSSARTCVPDNVRSFHLNACGTSVDFVIDDQRLNPVHPGVREYRAIAPGRNKVSVKFFDPSMDTRILDSAAAEAAALSILGGRVSPTLFESSIPCISIVHSYHGYHSLGDLREVASVPSTDLLLRLAIRGLEMLRDMHQIGIVHGSVNLRTLRYRKTPNVRNDEEIVSSVRLVDFWISSRLFVDVTRKALASDVGTFSLQPVAYMSIYQLESSSESGQVPSPTRRDDILGLAEALLMLALGDYEIFDLSDPGEVFARKRDLGLQATGRVDPRLYTLYKKARELERGTSINYDQMIVSLR